jgi:D-tagatose-1,6-bisphosphate aldolase subunit GatZ/KbaZ
MRQARADDSPLLLEATSNQVNQFGGYTRMRPADFRSLVHELAQEESLPTEQIILGGDHLGPNPWQHEPAKIAMAHAEDLVAEFAREGFAKLHLDASMPCADDPSPLLPQTVALRSARLCAAAERVGTGAKPVYVIGTEVPTPGGATEALESLRVTTAAVAEETLEEHRRQFAALGLREAFERVIAIVVQPGVEFNHDSVHEYNANEAAALASWLRSRSPLVFEAHSSDYQREQAYSELLRDGFAILKVGPAVTFAMREAIFALAAIETSLLPEDRQSHVRETVERVMLQSPANWKTHYHGNKEEQRLLRTFSYSDRIRYYWSQADVHASVERLMTNLRSVKIPETMLSASLPLEYAALRDRKLDMDPVEILLHATQRSLLPYANACFHRR